MCLKWILLIMEKIFLKNLPEVKGWLTAIYFWKQVILVLQTLFFLRFAWCTLYDVLIDLLQEKISIDKAKHEQKRW